MATKPIYSLLPFIRQIETMGPLSQKERVAIENLPVTVRALRPRQDIMCDGETVTQCCLVLEGWLCRYKIIGDGKRQIFSFHIAGDVPDLQSLHIPLVDHNIATLTAASVAFIPHAALHDLTTRFPGIASALWRNTLVESAIFREWLLCMGRRSSFDHMAHLLCELYLKQEAVGLAGDHRCPLPVTQVDLADATGLSSVHVNRVLQEMRGKGMITLRSNTLVIRAWSDLFQTAEFDGTYLHQRKRMVG